MPKVTPFLMFNDGLGEAIEFYPTVFADTKIHDVTRYGDQVQSASFEIGGQVFNAYNGGPHFSFSEGFSLFVTCEDQAEVDMYWDKLTADGGEESKCGWLKDKFGLSWQIVPKRFMELMGSGTPEQSQRVIQAMMGMNKFIIADLEKAYAGE